MRRAIVTQGLTGGVPSRWLSVWHEFVCSSKGSSHLIVARLYAVAAAGSGTDPVKVLFPVFLAAAAATAAPVAGHGVIYLTALPAAVLADKALPHSHAGFPDL